MDLTIKPVETKKSNITQNEAMDANIIPRHPSAVLFNGRSGSGKSVLIHNLLSREGFYAGYFDMVFLFSGAPDDIYDSLKIPSRRVFSDDRAWESKLDLIFTTQQDIIKKKGIDKSPKILVIFEDIQNHQSFMRKSKWFLKCFIANRHFNVSTWITAQSYTKTPRACRINVNNAFLFQGTQSERKLIIEEYCPSALNKKQFGKLIDQATGKKYHFLHINNRCHESERFRHNLGSIIKF